jgi:hypothetical protein
VLPAGQQRP